MTKRSPLTFDAGKTIPPAKITKKETGLSKNLQTTKHANDATSKNIRSDRANKQFIAAHVQSEAAKQFKLLAVQQEHTVQALLIEAINDLFAKYGLSRIADE